MKRILIILFWAFAPSVFAQVAPQPLVPQALRSSIDAERMGTHDANRIRTRFFNFGMVGDYEGNPDLSVFHSVEVPKGSGINYSDGITPFVLAKVKQRNGTDTYIMETGFRERQGLSPVTGKVMRFEPRAGYFEADPSINKGRSVAISSDYRTWPGAANAAGDLSPNADAQKCWIDKTNDKDDAGWCGSWNGFFGKRPNADQESFSVMDDNFYDAWDFYPDIRDEGVTPKDRRRGLGLRIEVRGFQWANPQASNVIFWHYDVINESTTDFNDNIMFGVYMDSGVGGSAISCDGYGETDDDNAFYTTEYGQDLVYTWDRRNTGVSLSSSCAPTGYLGYAYLETPGNSFNGKDDDDDGITDEKRDGGAGQKIIGKDAIRAEVNRRYDLAKFEIIYGKLEDRPAYQAGIWWTGDEDLDWVAELHDTGGDGIFKSQDSGELDGMPTDGEPNFDKTDIHESDMIGLTGFKLNRIKPGPGAAGDVDGIVFFNTGEQWPKRLYEQFSNADPTQHFDKALVQNYNIAFLFASGPFKLQAGRRERFSLALAYGENLTELQTNVKTVQQIYEANYQFAVPPPMPTVKSYINEKGNVVLSWDNVAEKGIDPVTNKNDFEGYKIYRSTDPTFLDPKKVSNAIGINPFPIGAPLVQFDLKNDKRGYSQQMVQGVAYYLGNDTGLTHTFTDSTVVAGQTYYYAVTAYDHGSDELSFFPSENGVTVSRTARGGTILPQNVVEVRPNKPVQGYVGAKIQPNSIQHTAGSGAGSLDVRIINDKLVPENQTLTLAFQGLASQVKAQTYTLKNAKGEEIFTGGLDFDGLGTGPVGLGLLPVVSTIASPQFNATNSGLQAGSKSNAVLQMSYSQVLSADMKREGYPESLVITFSDVPIDQTLAAIGIPANPVKFKVTGAKSKNAYKIRFRDTNGDQTLSANDEYIEVVTYDPATPSIAQPTWRIQLDAAKIKGSLVVPTKGDVYTLAVDAPFGIDDVFTFKTSAAYVDPDKAKSDFDTHAPYVVPNPYVASASFEPERFAVAGRGERRMEFRNIPTKATVRIYTLRGELVQTLIQDGSTTGMIPWDLRSKDNLEIAPGLYLFYVETVDKQTLSGKFSIIK
jgi:hypothetical protein